MWLRRLIKCCNIFCPRIFCRLENIFKAQRLTFQVITVMHAIIYMPTKLDIFDKFFDDVFFVNLKYAVIVPSRLRLKDILKF